MPTTKRIHGELKQRAEAELQTHPTIEQLKQASGKYSEVEFVKSDSSHQGPTRSAGPSMKLNDREWDETMQKLAATFSDRAVAAAPKAFGAVKGDGLTQIKVGIVSSLREDEIRYYATTIIEKTNDHLKLATIGWPKEPLEPWLARVENRVPTVTIAPSGNYRLPKISDGATCIDDTWTATAAPPDARDSHTAVWTGAEMIIWGGETRNFDPLVQARGTILPLIAGHRQMAQMHRPHGVPCRVVEWQ